MQNNVTDLTQKLLRSLDSNYNVIDMSTVIEIISILEKITITKELLQTTRLGYYVNQFRRNPNNRLLAKRAKGLVKRWRDTVLPDSNGLIKHTQEDVQKKRSLTEPLEVPNAKKPRINGQLELDFSDNSNSSFKDTKSIILINSDSNSSLPDTKQEPPVEQQQPKKRGRKKGSKNHKNLIEEAETSFSNKLNVSRGNAKVKTTQELLADLHIKNCVNNKPVDLNEKAAKLSERVLIIDQKLNATNRFRNFQKKAVKNEVIESGVVSNAITSDDEIIVVDDLEVNVTEEETIEEEIKPIEEQDAIISKSLSVEEALALLPPLDRNILEEKDLQPQCTCQLVQNKTDLPGEDGMEESSEHTFQFVEDGACLAQRDLADKYNLGLDRELLNKHVERLHTECIPNVNGNYGVGRCKEDSDRTCGGLYLNVVPNVNTENLLKFSNIDYTQSASENFKKYSISEMPLVPDGVEGVPTSSDSTVFREWHEVLDTPSYNSEILKILPYVVID